MYTIDLNALQLAPCKVLGVHKQDGTEPFYTLQRLGDEAGAGQEIQTERHRYGVLLAPLYRTTSYRTGCLHIYVCVGIVYPCVGSWLCLCVLARL